MYISKIELENWRNFSTVNISLAEKAIIIGPNASGKSNLLDSIRFLRDLVKEGGGLQTAVRQRGGLSKIRSLSARRNNRVKIVIEVNDDDGAKEWRYELEFTQRGGGIAGESVALVTHEKLVQFSDKKQTPFISRSPSKETEYLTRFTTLEQANINHKFRDFADFIGGVSYLHIVPQLVRDPHSSLQQKSSEDYFGRDFISMLAGINQKTRDAFMTRISKFLRVAVPGFETIKVDKDELGEPHLYVEFKSWRGINAKHNESQLSDGTLRLIGLLWTVQYGRNPVLLEEPELSLHPEIVRRLYAVITELYKNTRRRRQVILTTHSFDFLSDQAILPEEVVLLTVDAQGVTHAENLASDQEILKLLKSGFTVAETALRKTVPAHIEQLSLIK